MTRVLVALIGCSLWLAGSALAQDVGAAHEAICCGDTCCLIEGDCLVDGEENPRNACQVCDPTMSQVEWTDVPGCMPPDAGQPADAGAPGGGGGCSIAPAGGSSAPGVLAGLAALALVWRRKR